MNPSTNETRTLTVCLDDQLGSLERMLCLVRRRGFKVKYLLVNQTPKGFETSLLLENMPFGSPTFENLACHLNNQINIASAELSSIAAHSGQHESELALSD